MTIGYFNGEIDNIEQLKIPLCDRSVFFGDAVYDAVLVLNKKPFTLDLHLDRLYRSCQLTQIPFTMERSALEAEIRRLIGCSEGNESMLYIQVTRGAAPRKHEYPKAPQPNLIMYVSPIHMASKDTKASLVSFEDLRFQYCNIKTTNLLPNVFASQKAVSCGATEALLHRGDRVTEAAHSSILILKDGAVIMPPLDNLILPGITRAVVQKVCEENGIPVEHRVFTVNELLNADEIMLCSTTKNVIFVFSVDEKPVGGKDRALALRIQELFLDRVFAQTGIKL